MNSDLQFWHTVLERGFLLTEKETGRPKPSEFQEEIPPENELWPGAVYKHEIYNEYTQWCRVKNEKYVESASRFWQTTVSIWPGGIVKEKRSPAKIGRVRYVILHPIEAIMDAFTLKTKIAFPDRQELK